MRAYFLIWGSVFFAFFIIYPVHANNKCYQAKICVHDGKEKCGRDGDGNLRRFLDSCDIREYNCLRGAEYTKVNNNDCNNLPSIDAQVSKEKSKKVKGDHGNQDLAEDNSESQDNSVNEEDQDVEHKSKEKKEDTDSSSSTEKRRNRAL